MPEARDQTIVVVEDEEEVRALVDRILSQAGYRVFSTTDPARTVSLVREHKPDLLLTDIAMPAMDGYAVLRALQDDPQTARCPVVFLSGHRDFSERVRAFRVGVVDYLTKPFTREVLLKKIERVLDARQRRPEPPAGADSAGEAREPASTDREPGADESAYTQDPFTLGGATDRLPSFEEFPPLVRDVLVVDDNSVFRRFVRDLLASRGFTVREATNGEEGLQVALEHRPWLILTDVRMPAGDGFEFCRRVRTHSLIRQTPLLFLSGWDDYKQRYQALKLGADDFLSKESSIRELLVRIQLLMKRYADLGGAQLVGGHAGRDPGHRRPGSAAGLPPVASHGRALGPGRALARECPLPGRRDRGRRLWRRPGRERGVRVPGLGRAAPSTSRPWTRAPARRWARGSTACCSRGAAASTRHAARGPGPKAAASASLESGRERLGRLGPPQQAQPLHLLVQRGRKNAELRGRAPLVPRRGLQGRLDELALVRFDQVLETHFGHTASLLAGPPSPAPPRGGGQVPGAPGRVLFRLIRRSLGRKGFLNMDENWMRLR